MTETSNVRQLLKASQPPTRQTKKLKVFKHLLKGYKKSERMCARVQMKVVPPRDESELRAPSRVQFMFLTKYFNRCSCSSLHACVINMFLLMGTPAPHVMKTITR